MKWASASTFSRTMQTREMWPKISISGRSSTLDHALWIKKHDPIYPRSLIRPRKSNNFSFSLHLHLSALRYWFTKEFDSLCVYEVFQIALAHSARVCVVVREDAVYHFTQNAILGYDGLSVCNTLKYVLPLILT